MVDHKFLLVVVKIGCEANVKFLQLPTVGIFKSPSQNKLKEGIQLIFSINCYWCETEREICNLLLDRRFLFA